MHIVGTTIPLEVIGHFGAGEVLLKPAEEGSGVAAGGEFRSVMELAGIADNSRQSLGRNTHIHMIRDNMDGLTQLRTRETVAELRGVSATSLEEVEVNTWRL